RDFIFVAAKVNNLKLYLFLVDGDCNNFLIVHTKLRDPLQYTEWKVVWMGLWSEAASVAEMNLQQAMQPKASSNGFNRRRGEREGGPRLENKMQSGKLNPNRSSNSGAGVKVGGFESPSRDRLVYLSACLIGHTVEVQLKNGSVYCGTCYTTNVEKEFAIILKMARMTKDVSFRGQKAESVSKAPSKTLIIPGKEIVQVIAKDLPVTTEGMSDDLQHAKQQDLMIDSVISQSRHVDAERELEPWVPDEDIPQCPELENIFDGHWNRGWNQFETNEMLFGVKSTFDEELYTTKLERGPQMRELEKEAVRIAREIEGEETQDLHLAEERGFYHQNFDVDEETRFSSVYRGRVADDSGYDEIEDIMFNSRNTETFGGTSASKKSTDLTHGKSDDGARVLSRSSMDDAQCSQPSTSVDFHNSSSYDHARSPASEVASKILSTSDGENRSQENSHGEHGRHTSVKESVKEHKLAKDAQLLKNEDSQSSLNAKKDNSQKEGLSSSATADASHVYSKSQKGAPVEPSETVVSSKVAGEVQPLNSRGRPGSSTSSNSECVGAVSNLASGGPGLSPSSSVGSLSSEKSTLNPHAKEFKLNPNAKSFTPSQTPVRPPSPVSDGSFYYQANVSAMPHMHGMPVGIGMGPSFTGHQPVIFNPQVSPLQSPQAYFHPGGPQYGQQMLVGHPRQVVYMPGYQPVSAAFSLVLGSLFRKCLIRDGNISFYDILCGFILVANAWTRRGCLETFSGDLGQMGPSFTGHQPVIFNPQVSPLQSPQAYFHPGGPQYGQQMLVGHPRQVVYMPGYQPVSAAFSLVLESLFRFL
ncbi:hypothetical protein Tsubulata_018475, partial [Turnera subulata]